MRLGLHLLANEFKRHAWWFALWQALLGINLIRSHLLLAGRSEIDFFELTPVGISGWLILTHLVTLSIITASVIQSDSLVSSTATWRTRPISSGRILATKLAWLGLSLLLTQAAALATVFWSMDLPLDRFLVGLIQGLAYDTALVLAAALVAALTSTLPKFSATAIATLLFYGWLSDAMGAAAEAPRWAATNELIPFGLYLLAAMLALALMAYLYLAKHRKSTAALALLALALVVRVDAKGSLEVLGKDAAPGAAPEPLGVSVEPLPPTGPRDSTDPDADRQELVGTLEIEDIPAGLFIGDWRLQTRLRLPDGESFEYLQPVPPHTPDTPIHSAELSELLGDRFQAVGFAGAPPADRAVLASLRKNDYQRIAELSCRLEVSARLNGYRAEVSAPFPIRQGATYTSPGLKVHLKELKMEEDRLRVLVDEIQSTLVTAERCCPAYWLEVPLHSGGLIHLPDTGEGLSKFTTALPISMSSPGFESHFAVLDFQLDELAGIPSDWQETARLVRVEGQLAASWHFDLTIDPFVPGRFHPSGTEPVEEKP